MYLRNVILAALAAATVALAQTGPVTTLAATDAPFQVRYAANLQFGESYIDVTNDGASGCSLLAPGFREALERKEAELVRVLRTRDGIAIEKSADQMDEIQYATERDLAIRNVDRDSTLLRRVKAALRRIQDGSFGMCIECEEPVSPKRLAAVPWAPRCIQCQSAADRAGHETAGESGDLVNAA